ncbi:peptidoglycan recognition protein family protein [Mucilaginibacter myungsuensis]|uniref:N-acetylmuramoyl-L-alanine amidase n=1 Tax=Mucilaginibacter myungsuensis TaxID=649104 RepID=A0A929KW99_9SPHI|nr:N-acetylmuramoyl-L-alanine amidase [Mucilaginibacter myungsuensis]MBE9661630.1 N-acetylmuramoyl-L-alanine amidase [Mucilaginibacter myungsuensis]MDN3597774.1 N-acetylmuramoyl-L-alanine amidase [Mucilaginibacter myungsuensis]
MAYSLTWLADVLKNAGLKVSETDGWKDRGHGPMGIIKGVLCHHTATPSKKGNMPALKVLINGHGTLKGPLSQLGLGRDGTYHLIAAGKCYHAGKGAWQGITAGNTHFIGIEAENTGGPDDQPWPEVQLDAYQRGVAAILKHIGKGAECCIGHKEYALPKGRKTDPGFDMDEFRKKVNMIINPPKPIPYATLRRGAKNDPALVKILQNKLGLKADADFGPKTETAVRAFQALKGIVADGVVGVQTWEMLEEKK